MSAAKLRFREYELDRDEFELYRAGRRVRLERKPMELLVLLAERQGQLTLREDIVEKIWGKNVYFDAENGVNNAIRKIRTALNDDAESPRFLETAVGKGYRFIAPVEQVPARTAMLETVQEAVPAIVPATAIAPAREDRRFFWSWRWGAAAVVLLLMGFAMLLGAVRKRIFALEAPRIHSLAVLPLNNLSGNPDQEYFADGMTDALITDLAQISDVKVISRTSSMQYKGTRKSLREIARALDVDGVIEGSAVRSGSKVRITAQLIYVPTDSHLWAESFEGKADDVVSVQDEMARAIADHIQRKLGVHPNLNTAHRPVNAEAYEAYLRGRYFFDKRDGDSAKKSVEYFRLAITADPEFAAAYAGLAEALPAMNWFTNQAPIDVMPEAKAAAKKALDLDDSLGEAHTALGGLLGLYDWNWNEAERELKRGLELSPNSSLTHERYAMWLQSVGRLNEAVEESRRAQALDPVSFFMNRELGRSLYLARRYDEAIDQLRRSAELQPESDVVWNFVSNIYEKQGKRDDVVRLTLEGKTDRDLSREDVASLQRAYVRDGWTGYWTRWLQLHAPANDPSLDAYKIAVAEARLGRAKNTWAWMETCADRRDVWTTWITVDPMFDEVRSDPAYVQLLRRVHLGN